MSHHVNRFNPVAPISRFYHGSFGRLFPNLPPWSPAEVSTDSLETHFLCFAKKNMADCSDDDSELNKTIPAGYTYFGQFIDHDMTHDVTPLNQSEIDPERLHNFRTPRLDLDSVYGRGPDEQPYLYKHDKEKGFSGKFLIGKIPKSDFFDLPRNSDERALIGDMRNDENAIVAQVHLAFLLAHNKLVDIANEKHKNNELDAKIAFNQARKTLRRLYQWVVWKDFLKRITIAEIHETALRSESLGGVGNVWRLGFQDIYNWKNQPFMPVEFSVAAYRFGHSMVRNSYRTNSGDKGFEKFIPIFDGPDSDDDLQGFRVLGKRRVLQWDWFLQMKSSNGSFPQHTRKINIKLSKALAKLPKSIAGENPVGNILAARNLVRGVRMKLPSGPDVARKLGLEPISLDSNEPESLWYYILKEAETTQSGERLGELGSLILCAVFAGILKGDPTSWVNIEPGWTPDTDPLLKSSDFNQDNENGEWELGSIIRLAGLPVSGENISGRPVKVEENDSSSYGGADSSKFRGEQRGPSGQLK